MGGGSSWCGRGVLSRRSSRERSLRRRARLGVVAAVFLALNIAVLPGAVALGPDNNNPRTTEVELDDLQETDVLVVDETASDKLEKLDGVPSTEPAEPYDPAAVVPVPAATGTDVPVTGLAAGTTKEVAASTDGTVTVGVGAPEDATAAEADALEGEWTVEVKPEVEAVAAGAQGLLLEVDPPDTATGDAVVRIDATRFAETYSAQWLDRLSFALMPACYLTTPDEEGCSTGTPLTTEVERTADEVTVPVGETGDDTGSETDPGEDPATDEPAEGAETEEQVQETFLNLTVDTATLNSVSATTGASAAASTDEGSVDSAVWRGDNRAGNVRQVASAGGGAVVMGTSYGAGAGGDFAATPLASAGAWSQGGSSGAFTYAYTMAGPQVPSGPSPNVTLSYNSQSSDGRTSATNNQVSWIGEGWDYNPGAITRTFVGCAADTANANNEDHFTGDQCWGSNNAVLTLNGTTTELVLDDDTGEWMSARGDNTRVELLTSADYTRITGIAASNNGDNNGEFWRVATSDGTQYYFGLNRLPGWTSGKEETKSVLNVPVAGNHSADPCHAAKFEDSFCDQGWRFQLDYVVDLNGNAMSLWWDKETNAYAKNNKVSKAVAYDRAGYLTRIDYGQRANTLFTAEPLGRMNFTDQQRCFKDAGAGTPDCSDDNFDSKQSDRTRPWYDTPADLACAAGAKCSTYAPTFWSRKRLATVTACAQRVQGVRLTEYNSADDSGARNACGIDDTTYGTTLLSKVDSWSLAQSFPWGLTGEYTALWLESITRTGYGVDGDTSHLNPVRFGHNDSPLPNRVKQGSGDTAPLFGRLRIQTVVSEYGGSTRVKYKAPEGGCATGTNLPTEPFDKNTLRCYPAYWHADGELTDKRISWFHKYVVGEITEDAQLADAVNDVTTTYEYETNTSDKTVGALWAKSQGEFSRPKTRTWDDWRGYPVTITVTGDRGNPVGSVASKSVTRYLRGMSDDVLADGTKRNFKVLDVTGAEIATDVKAYAGMVAESLTYPDYNADTTSGWISRTVNYPDAPVRLATRDRTDGPDVVSERVTLGSVKTVTKSSGTRPGDSEQLRTVLTETDYDATYGLPTEVREYGDEEKPNDESCTRTSYVHNDSTAVDGVYLIGLVSQTITTTGTSTCSTALSAATGSTLVTGSRVFYDDATSLTATPTKGQATRTVVPAEGGTSWNSSFPESRTTYDGFGRVTKVTGPTGLANTTAYEPSSGQVYKITTVQGTNVVESVETGLTSVTTMEPGRGATLVSTDPNGRASSYEYDPLGRTTAAWDPTQPATDDPTARYTYNTPVNEPVSVVTESLERNPTSAPDGTKAVYTTSTAIYDGLGRERQSQTPAVDGGRLVTDTFHNSSGQVSRTNNAYYMSEEPGTELVVPDSDSLIPNATYYTYDGLGRVLTVTPYHNSYAQDGTTHYNGTTPVPSTDRTTRYEYGLDYTIVRQPKGTPGSRVWTDALGRTVQQDTYSDTVLTEAGAISTTYDYDLRGDMVTSTDEVGHSRTWTYDALGRVIGTIDPDAGDTSTDYDAAGRVASATDALDGTLAYSYERYLRVSEVNYTPAGGTSRAVQSYAYDSAPGGKGQLASAKRYTDGVGYTTSIAGYTADYQPTSMTLTMPDGTTSGTTADGFKTNYTYNYTYNEDGQLEKYTTPEVGGLTAESVITRYNEAGLPVTVSGDDWYVTETDYSPYGQVLRSTVGEIGHRLWQDNSFNESTGELLTSVLVREKATDTSVVSEHKVSQRAYSYDPSGNILSVADRVGTNAVDRQCFTYDALGQLKTAWTTPSGGSCTATGKTTAEPVYADGKVNVSSNNDGYWQSYEYDVLGNRKSKTVHKADPTVTSGTVATNNDVTTDYAYGENEDTAVKNDQPHTLTSYTTKSRTAAGAEVKTLSAQTYDDAGNLTNRTTGGDTSQGLTWTWDGQVESVTGFGPEGSGAWVGASEMCLDLTDAGTTAGTALQLYVCNGTKAQNFRLDALDTDNNGTVESAAIGQFVVGGRCAQPTSAAAGAAVQIQVCNKATTAQHWEVLGTGLIKLVGTSLCMNAASLTNGVDLVLATCSASATGQVFKPASKTTYVYDAMGNRVLERSAAGAVLHLPDTTVSLTPTGKLRAAERSYGHGGAPVVTRYREASSTSGATEQVFANAVDHNGTPLAEVQLDGDQSVRVTKKDPWGEDRTSSVATRSRTAYATGDDDAGSGLVHLGAREYDPATGRFISVDPVLDQSDPLQANGYSYANNNPVTHSDPSGLTSTASSFDASMAALDAKIAEYQRTLSVSIGDVILSVGWAVFKEFVGWDDIVGCFSQGDLWACGSLLMDAIPWTSIFSKGKKMWKAFEATLSAVKAWRVAKAVAEAGLKAAKAAKAALIKAKKAAEAAAAEAKRKARAAAKAAAEAAKKKAHTGSKGARGNAPQVQARKTAQSKGSDGGGKAESKSGGSRGGSGRDDSDSGGGSDGGSGSGGSCPTGGEATNSFTPDTRVVMADGSTKAIKDVKVGDEVMATDPETGETKAETVTAEIKGEGIKHLVDVTIDTDGTKGSKTAEVTATDGHPFWVPELREWIDATDLQPGQWLQTGASTDVQITAIRLWTAQAATVHNLTVSNFHTYYVLAGAAPVLVHNSNGCGPDNQTFATRSEAKSAAYARAGISSDAVPDAVWTVGDDVNRRGMPGYRFDSNPGAHGTYEQFETGNGSRLIAEHTNDPNAPFSHFHAGQPKVDPTREGVNFGWDMTSEFERYSPVGGSHHMYYESGG
ncbi:ricin-type beta-trefoil lectin domain protein [Streptomyces geranii]|uniref:ricin-type beta-trefoil lectin domain protein n=1 Tax=Streptomyces geranii TaxID=2058923 RepID=UPI0013007EFB|nr:ricin-type beta-trefoil lectin domain protein [Streptomyces geranii]